MDFWREHLLDLALRDGVGFAQLWPVALVLALVLGYSAYTDAFCGRIIRNSANLCVAAVAVASAPLLYADVERHFLTAALVIAGIFVLYMVGVFVEGDLKLYSALALLFGQATVVIILVSWVVIVLYGAPAALRNRARRRADIRAGVEKPRKAYLTKVPAGPGIAVAYPVTLAALGVTAGHCLLLVVAQVVVVALSLLFADIDRRAAALDEAKHLAEAETTANTAHAPSPATLAATPPAPVKQPSAPGRVVRCFTGCVLAVALLEGLRGARRG